MSIEFESLEDKLEEPKNYLGDYDHEEDLMSAKEHTNDLEEYIQKLKQDIIVAQDWQKQLINWILNAEKPVEDGNTP